MQIAIFDYKVVPTNAIGSCHLKILHSLCHEHDFTVFSVESENPCPERVRFVRVPAPTRPLALLFLAYHLMAPLVYLYHKVRTGVQFDLIQTVESNLSFGHLAYAHFCHRAYLRDQWPQVKSKGIRGWLRWYNHRLHALVEPWIYRRVKWIVVPSEGLRRELEAEYPFLRGKINVIANSVDTKRLQKPNTFDRETMRQSLGIAVQDFAIAFVALGNFEHKGLALLLEAQQHLENTQLIVVGGEHDVVSAWQRRVKAMKLDDKVRFLGMQRDIRPFLWAADAFVLASASETFSLVTFQAAAAGLPLVVTPLHGVEEFMRDGETGYIVQRSVEHLTATLNRLLAMSQLERAQMGENAQLAVQAFSVDAFVERWRGFYHEKLEST